MKRVVLAAALACPVVAAAGVSGCEAILGMDGHDAHLAAVAPAGDAGDAGARIDAAVPPCTFPSLGDAGAPSATLRVGNLVPSAARVDVCLTRSGSPSPIDGKPILASARGACPAGIGYKDVTIPFDVEEGTYAVAILPQGSACSALPLVTAQVTVAASTGAGVYLLGDGQTADTSLVLHEASPLGEGTSVRFIHAIAGASPFDFGVSSPAAPYPLEKILSTNVAYDSVGTTADPNGYTQVTTLGGAVHFGIAPTGTSTVTLVADPALAPAYAYSAFAIGTPGNVSYPEELYVCNERGAEGVLTSCGSGGSAMITVDVFDPFIWGPFAALGALREPAIGPALAKLSSDVVCIPDAFGDTASSDILAKAAYPYSVHFADTLTTPVDDPTFDDGGAPPAPAVAPCVGYEGLVEPFLDCLNQYCTTTLDDPDASILDYAGSCITNNCANQAEGLLLTMDPKQLACWNCAFFSIQGGATIADTQTACLTNVNAGYAFSGQSGVSILSRLKAFAPAEQWVLPSTNWRSNIIRAPLTLPGGGELDAYCLIISDPNSSITVPYTGQYGNGANDVTGWDAELALQVQKIVAYVKSKSTGVPAIIGGEFYAGPAATDGTQPLNTFAYQTLSAAFPIAATSDGPPGCTLCAVNPILTPPGATPATADALSSYALLANIPVTDVASASIELRDLVLDAGTTEAGLPYLVPLSTYYDYRTTIRVRP